MLKYLKESLKRKKARRITATYPTYINVFDLPKDGIVQFANWANPLVSPISITQSQVDFFRKFIQKGDFVIDIGANIGDTTVPMALAAGKNGLAIGIDPNPYVIKVLEENASLNKEKYNIVPMPYAITNQEDYFYYVSSEASFANGAVSKTKKSHHGKFVYPEKVKGIKLHQYLKENFSHLLPKLSLIKIDAEGSDKKIIKSINELITTQKPSIIAEVFGRSSNQDKMELFNILRQNAYSIFHFNDFVEDCIITELKHPRDILAWKETVNIFATTTH